MGDELLWRHLGGTPKARPFFFQAERAVTPPPPREEGRRAPQSSFFLDRSIDLLLFFFSLLPGALHGVFQLETSRERLTDRSHPYSIWPIFSSPPMEFCLKAVRPVLSKMREPPPLPRLAFYAIRVVRLQTTDLAAR